MGYFSYKRLLIVFLVILVITIIVLYKVYNPIDSIYFPKCLFKGITGYKCPGCGSQTAVHHLLNLNIFSAFKANAILIFAIPYLILCFAFEMVKKPTEKQLMWRKRLFGERAIYIVLTIIILFWILRNIPFISELGW